MSQYHMCTGIVQVVLEVLGSGLLHYRFNTIVSSGVSETV